MSPVVLPTEAYVPGQTVRPADGAYDAIRDTAQAGMDVDALAACDAFQAGLAYLDAGFFWEAHEVLEPVWMLLDEGSVERRFVQGLIQLANGLLKLRMARPKAALRLASIARELMPEGTLGAVMGVDLKEMQRRIDALEVAVESAL